MTAIRRPGATSGTVLLAISAGLVLAHAIAPDWSRRVGLDVWNYAALDANYRAAADEHAEMRVHEERSTSRRAAGNQVAASLVNAGISLPAAADELIEIFREDEGMRIVLEAMHRDAPTERHIFARHAIGRVRGLLVDDPARRDAIVARLEVEYRAMCPAPESPRAP